MSHRIQPILHAAIIFAGLGATAAGCATRRAAIEVPDAALGRVIVYRNGVAYFERRATVEGELVLAVPGDRVDDFLKSLTIVDAATGDSLPLSYPTVQTGRRGPVTMTIALPRGRRDVRIAYVTESPAWKPSYRVMLGDGKDARLQAWAVVDNVSDEPWRRVSVGVGSTSALSFRYDLHSVQTVERQTIDGDIKLAAAPPSGGSPYAVAGDNVRVLADLSAAAVDAYGEGVARGVTASRNSAGIALGGGTVAKEVRVRHRRRGGANGSTVEVEHSAAVAGREFTAVVDVAPTVAGPSLDAIAAQLAGNTERIRVEGWAGEHDGDRGADSLRRANTLRDALAARGVSLDRIDVVGYPQVAASDKLVRVVAVDAGASMSQARVDGDDDGLRGDAQFMTDKPITVAAGHSAMVTLFDSKTAGERVFLYDPVSERGSKRFAFNAVRLVNPTDNTLDAGPITVYADRQFLGEGLTESVPPHAATLVPYGLDRSVVVTPKIETHEEIESFRAIDRGLATTETLRIRRIDLELANRGHQGAHVFIRHRVPSGWTLRDPPKGTERLGTDYVIPVRIEAGKAGRLVLVESTPVTTTIDLRSREGARAVAEYLDAHPGADELRTALRAIVDAQGKLAAVDDTLETRRAHATALRARIDELSDQLVALRKVGRAQSISGHLAKRMRTVGDKLDAVATEISDLETRHLETRIEVDGLVAELAFRAPRAAAASTGAASP